MAKIKKRTGRTQIRPIQDFRSIAEGAADHYRAYQKPYNTALTVLVVALLAGLLYSFMQSGKEKKAAQMFDAAYSFYRPAGGLTGDLPRALQGFRETVQQYGSTLAGASALYFSGNVLVEMGRMEDAVKAYEEFTKQHSSRTFLLAMVQQRLGYAYAAQGRREDALRAFSRAESLAGTGPATLEQARLYERIGSQEEAQKKYKQVTEDLAATTLAMEARSKLPPPDLKPPVGAGERKTGN